MRIAIFTELYAPSVGGQEVFFAGLGRALSRRGHQLDVYCIAHQKGLPASEVLDGVWVHRTLTAPNYTRPRFAAMRREWAALSRFALHTRRIAQRREHDFYLLNQWPFMHVVTLPRHARRRALLHWCEIRESGFFRMMQSYLPRQTWLNGAISESVGRRIRALSGCEAMTLPSGLDLEKASYLPRNERSDILAVSRIAEHKNLVMLVAAFEIMRQHGYAGRLKIAGDGPAMGALRVRVASSPARSGVDLLGRITEAEKFSLMSRCEVLAMPSKREGFPHALSEAMSCGLPIVTADYPENGTRAVVEAFGSGIVTSQSAEALAAGMERLRNGWDLYSANGRKAARTLDWNAIAETLEARLMRVPG
ncbi:glycosyltransferase family 4 protein [Lichenicoccus sp.]|uniref:glycosyltransferase family 4 protein n=1 Tax=Lichenicoccus sp. TaxID=2781899 RepID=UPI003D0E7001